MSGQRTRRLSAVILGIALLTGASAPEGELLDATKRGDIDAVQALLSEGVNPNFAQGDGLTALHVAAQEGNIEIAKVLIRAGATVEVRTRLGEYTPLHLASAGAHSALVRTLLDAGADPRAVTTTTGVTPLHLAAKVFQGEGVIRLLLERGVVVDAREARGGQTPLMFAAASGRAEAAKELLRYGADPGIRTEVVDVLERMFIDRAAQERLTGTLQGTRNSGPDGTELPLSRAQEQAAIAAQREFLLSEEEIAKVLSRFNRDDLAEIQPLWVTQAGLVSKPRILARPIGPTLVGKTGGMTALLFAARDGQSEAVKLLLDSGADIDQVSGDGSTALVLAALNGEFDIAMLLIERGADPNIVTETDGVSPLFAVLETKWAVYDLGQPRAHLLQVNQHMDLVKALLEAGADPKVRLKTHLWHFSTERLALNITGATPFWRAAMAQDLEAMKTLIAYGADPHVPTIWPELGMRADRQQDGRRHDDSGLPRTEGQPALYPLHAAAGGGYLGLGSIVINGVPNSFIDAVQYLVEEHGADVNLPDSWGYTPLHYAAVKGGNNLIEYLVSKGADVTATSVLGQSPVDMARGGRAGFFERAAYPETVELLLSLGSPFKCLNTIFRGTGDYCEGVGVRIPVEEERVSADDPVDTQSSRSFFGR